jgi:hypothetical protein
MTDGKDPLTIAGALLWASTYGIEQLLGSPDIIPRSKGFYSWWMIPGSVPGLAGLKHPEYYDIQLLYVGIASRPSSHLQQRLTTHMVGTSRRSTQRLSLAALLAET